MILGTGELANGARRAFGDVPFVWLLEADVPDLELDTLIVVSHPQLVGTTAQLESRYPQHDFAYVPENVRGGHPEDWKTQARFVIGARKTWVRIALSEFFTPALFMSPESAEMVKHGLNGWLAHSIAYARELARVSRVYGADPEDVAAGLMSDPRVGELAYLNPTGDVSPHLNREVVNLRTLGFRL